MSLAGKLIFALLLSAGLLVLIWRLLSRQLGVRRTRLFFAAASLALVSVAASLAAAEIATRWLLRDITTTADNSSFFARRWQAGNPPRINQAGYRERNYAPVAPDHVYRIALVGDSIAYGQGISEPERFGNLLETDLSTDGRAAEVLNFSLPGNDTDDHLETLRKHVLLAEPDFVLLQWFVNDVEIGRGGKRPKYWRLIPSAGISRFLHHHSALFYLVKQQWVALQRALRPDAPVSYNEYMQTRFRDEQGPGAVQADAVMREFIEECLERGITVGIVLFPQMSNQLSGDYPLAFLHQRVRNLCSEYGLTCLDLTQRYAAEADLQALWVNRFDAHPGNRANAIAAQELLAAFGPAWAMD